jgi:branched-subunit amino acid transport protein
MTIWLIIALALLTYLSRAAALVLLPRPSERFEAVLRRVPAPLFAGFAAISLVTDSRVLAPMETLAAVVAAVVATRTKSLLIILAAGSAGYLVAVLVRTLM